MVAAVRRAAARCRIRSACRSRACARRSPGAARGRCRRPLARRSPAQASVGRVWRVIDDEQVIADGVVGVLVAATQLRCEASAPPTSPRRTLCSAGAARALSRGDGLRDAPRGCRSCHRPCRACARGTLRRGRRAMPAAPRDQRYGLPLLAGRQSGGHAPGRKSHAASPWLFAALGFKPCRYLPAGVRHIFQWPSADSTIP